MKILYLYSELMGYQIPIFKEYVIKYNAEVHVLHWDHKKLTPYKPPVYNNIYYYNRSSFTLKKLKEFVLNLNPDIVYISGWMDKGYLAAVRPLRKNGIPVITGMDDIWWKTIRQRVASILFPPFRKVFFSHAWVAGPYQFEFAKRLGFKNTEIIHNCLSGDIEIFNKAYIQSIGKKKKIYPHRLLYAGRLETTKGINILIQAWDALKEKRKDWELCIIGNGSLYDFIASHNDIVVFNFMQPEVLVKEIENSGCYILPSIFEPWALVLHEFSAAGLPIICSDVCGAAPVFVIPGYNGFTFKAGDVFDLEQKMLRIINSSDDELIHMAENSHNSGQKITPEIAAASFISIIK
jgi:glycosyltransferase involved in cell wall biosynthesis